LIEEEISNLQEKRKNKNNNKNKTARVNAIELYSM